MSSLNSSVLAAVAAMTILAAPATALPDRAHYRPAPRIQISFRPSGLITPEVDLRPQINNLGLAIRDQGDRGTCSVFATTFILEFAEASTRSARGLDLSEEYLNWAKNKANNTSFDGGFFTEILAGYTSYGMVREADMPYQASYNSANPDRPSPATIRAGRQFDQFPVRFIKQWDNQHGMTQAELGAAKAALRDGTPVATGIWWLTNFETVTVDRVPLLKEYPRSANNHADPSKNPMFDGHSIDLVGYHEGSQFPGGGYFIFRNSFGTGFGHDGYGFVSFDYMLNYSNDAIVAGPARRGWTQPRYH